MHVHNDLTTDSEQPCSSGLAVADINDLDHANQFCNPPAAKCSDCSEVAIFVRSSSTSAQKKYDLLVSHFKPAANYEFPKRSGGH